MFGSNTGSSGFTFGSSNQNQGATPFGQAQNQNTSPFGQSFGQNPAPGVGGFGSTGSIFGQSQQPATSGFGGFGSTTSTPSSFGTQGQPFGVSTTTPSTGLFGSSTTNNPSSFGFGSNAPTTPAFGSGTATGGLFGQNKPATTFGSTTTPSGGIFGQSTPTPSFGASTSTAFGGFGGSAPALPTGTSNPVFAPHTEAEGSNTLAYQTITTMPAYQKASLEELRLADYEQGRRFGTEGGTGAFGQPTAFGAGTNTGTSTFGGTAFGQSTQPSGGLFGSNTTSTPAFVGSTTTNTFSGTNTGGGLFGSNASQPQPGGLFGRSTTGTTGTGLFGTTTTTTPSTGFGFGSTQPAQNTPSFGGFGQNAANQQKPAFGFGQSTTGLNTFGSSQTNAPGSGGLFGQSSSTPAFGAANTTTRPGFGTNTPQSGGIFGNVPQQKPAFSFGSSTTGPSFGQSTAGGPTSGGLFGSTSTSTPQQSGGLFGNVQNPNAPATGGMFGTPGSSQQPASGGLFTSTSGGGLFGNTNTGAGGGLFSQKPATGGLFGATTAAQPATGGLFGGSSTFGNTSATGSTLFGNTSQPSSGLFGQSTQQPQQQLQASIDSNPYGANPLFQSIGSGQQSPLGPIATPLKTNSHKPKPAMLNQFKLTPRPVPSPRLLNFRPVHSPASPMGSRNMHLFDGRSDDSTLSPDAFTPRSNIKKLVIDRKVSEADLLSGGADWSVASQVPHDKPTRPQRPSFSHVGEEDIPRATSNKPQSSSGQEKPESPRYQSPDVKSKEVEGTYWTSPAMSVLLDYPRDALRLVKNFKVGRRGYGQISFNEPVDLTDVAAIEYIPGKIVIFDSKLCTVYPDEEEKPPVGHGLNVPATITLEGCWPFSKADRKPITDPENHRLIQHVERLKKMNETEFVDYISDTGSWVFKVKHFSKYGLQGSDDEDGDDQVNTHRELQLRVSQIRKQDGFPVRDQRCPAEKGYGDMSVDETFGPEDTFAFKRSLSTRLPGSFESPIQYPPLPTETYYTPVKFDNTTEEAYEETQDPSYSMSVSESESQTMNQPSEQSQERTSTDQGELYSELDEDNESFSDEFEDGSLDRAISRLDHATSWSDQLQSFRQLPPSLAKSPFLMRKAETIPSVVYGHYELNRDIFGEDDGLAKNHKSLSREPTLSQEINVHRCIKPRWGNGFTLVTLDPLYSSSPEQNRTVTIQKIKVFANDSKQEMISSAFDAQLQHTSISNDHGIPAAFPDETLSFKTFSDIFNAKALASINECRTWSLAQILFDRLIPNLPDDVSPVTRDAVVNSLRKESLSEWLQEGSRRQIDEELAQTTESCQRIFINLTGHRIEEACIEATKSSNFRLAMLLSLAGGDDSVREDLWKQIEDWKEKGILSHISEFHRMIYELLSGNVLQSSTGSTDLEDFAPELKISRNLDWERAFALRLWYAEPEEQNLESVISSFASYFSGDFAMTEKPWTWYQLSDSSFTNSWKSLDRLFDMKYHLLLLQADRKHPLEESLLPRTCTPSPLDTRLSWHFYCILSHVKRIADFSDREKVPTNLCIIDEHAMGVSIRANQLTLDYAWQLEGLGLWEWAIFVLLHLETENTREQAIRDILGRNIESLTNANDPYLLTLLTEKMHIPKPWLLEAKALLARYLHRYWDEAENLIEAKAWEEAHRTVISRIGPSSVIEMNLGDLKDLLEKFKCTESIPEWNLGGQVYFLCGQVDVKIYLDYVYLAQRIEGNPLERETRLVEKKRKQSLRDACDRLISGLPLMQTRLLPQRVAMTEVSTFLARNLEQMKDSSSLEEKQKLLHLILPQNEYLSKTAGLSLDYFRALLTAH